MRQGWIVAAVWMVAIAGTAAGQTLPKHSCEGHIEAPCMDTDCCVPECCCCEPCQERFFASTEYLLFWLREQNIPVPLVTTNPTGLPALGVPGTSVVSPDNFNYGATSGVRLNAGTWFRRNPRLGFLASGFLLEQANSGFAYVDPSGTTVLAQPTPGGGFITASAPGAFGGGVIASANTRLWGAEANLVGQVVDNANWNLSLLGGFRYLDMSENLDLNAPAVNLTTNAFAPAGTFSDFQDSFDTRNQFYGGQLGGRLEYRRNRVFFNSTVKVAMGDTRQAVNTVGAFVLTPPGGPTTLLPGGTYVFPGANAGNFSRDRFAVIPEVQLNLGYQFNRYLSAFVGYNFLYWSNVERPADQISMVAPVIPSTSTDFWMHGLSAGLGLRF